MSRVCNRLVAKIPTVPHPTMHHFVTEMCTCVHISVTKWCIVEYLINSLWDLWDGPIAVSSKGSLFIIDMLHMLNHTTIKGHSTMQGYK